MDCIFLKNSNIVLSSHNAGIDTHFLTYNFHNLNIEYPPSNVFLVLQNCQNPQFIRKWGVKN